MASDLDTTTKAARPRVDEDGNLLCGTTLCPHFAPRTDHEGHSLDACNLTLRRTYEGHVCRPAIQAVVAKVHANTPATGDVPTVDALEAILVEKEAQAVELRALREVLRWVAVDTRRWTVLHRALHLDLREDKGDTRTFEEYVQSAMRADGGGKGNG